MRDLSIIIISYNTRQSLKKCLESLSDQLSVSSGQGSGIGGDRKNVRRSPITGHRSLVAEIIVVDNGSSDGSVEMVREFGVRSLESGERGKPIKRAKSLPTPHSQLPTLRLIENQKNLGFAKAVNQGINQAEGETIFLLNSDTVIKEEALMTILSFEKKVRPAIIGAQLVNPNNSLQPSVFHLPTVKNAISEYWFGKKDTFSKYLPATNRPVEVEAVVGGAMLISKKVIEAIGLFDERYFMYFEDLDYCRRARKAGFKIYYLPSAKILHEHGLSGKAMPKETNQWLVESSKIYYGAVNYFFITLVIKIGQIWQKFFENQQKP